MSRTAPAPSHPHPPQSVGADGACEAQGSRAVGQGRRGQEHPDQGARPRPWQEGVRGASENKMKRYFCLFSDVISE